MGIREKLNENPAITTGATIAIILIAIVVIVVQIFSGNSQQGSSLSTAYYTTDDTSPEAAMAALFGDDIGKLPPFDHNGKPAYRAFVFTCDGGKTKWISHIQRYTKEAQTKLAAAQADKSQQQANAGAIDAVQMNGIEIKKPGPGPWVKQMDVPKSRTITDVKCPDGTLNNIDPVAP